MHEYPMVEKAHVKVRDINEESAKREKAVSEREVKLAEESGRIQAALERNEKTLTEILTKTSYLEGRLSESVKDADEKRDELVTKLIKVNEILGI